MQSLRLVDYSDRELLHMVQDHAGQDGWTDSLELAKALGIEGKRKAQSVGSRLSWLRRYGAVENESGSERMKWRVSPMGEILARGELRREDQKALKALKPEQMLLVTRFIAKQQREAPPTAGQLIRREWVHTTSQNGST